MRQAYDTDLTDQEWETIMPMLPKPFKLGSPATVNKREILNGIFYILKNGCTWQNLPMIYHHTQQYIFTSEDGQSSG
jgi:putative transposase